MRQTTPARIRRFRLAASTLAMVVLATGVTLAATMDRELDRPASDGDGRAMALAVADLARAVASTTTAPTTTAPALPQPIAVPDEEYAGEPEVVVARLQIPAIGLDTNIYEGISLTAIDRGPSHWPGTAMPGQLGNVVVAGHRVTHSRPFRHLDQLKPGDEAIFTTEEGTFTYEFESHDVVTPDRTDIADQTAEYRATLFACHPPHSARYRIVANWRLVGEPPS